jgi:hypothetical protein
LHPSDALANGNDVQNKIAPMCDIGAILPQN